MHICNYMYTEHIYNINIHIHIQICNIYTYIYIHNIHIYIYNNSVYVRIYLYIHLYVPICIFDHLKHVCINMDSCDVFTIVFRKKKAGVILTIWTVPTRVSLINKLYKEILLSSRVLYPLPKSEKAFCSWIKRWIGMGWWVLSLGWVLGCLV